MKQWYASHTELFNKRPYNCSGRDIYYLLETAKANDQERSL
jgi:hypothetical protein